MAAALVLVVAFRRFWVADYLQNPAALGAVVAAFTAANLLQDEAGLLAVTVMGVVLASQRYVPFKHILDFKESLSVVLVSGLFVLLGSRLRVAQIEASFSWSMAGFLLVIFLVARPLSVLLSARGSALSWRDRAFLCWMAPRGIVAAAVSSVFALRLGAEYPEAARLVPVTFAVIISTVIVYGLSASWVARMLGLSGGTSTGFLIAGADPLARMVGRLIRDAGQHVVLVDTRHSNVAAARRDGLETHALSAVSEAVIERIDGKGVSRLLALTPNEEMNTLAALHFARLFGRSQVYQLAPEEPPPDQYAATRDRDQVSQELRGRLLFTPGTTYEMLTDWMARGAKPEMTQFTEEFTFEQYRESHRDRFIPMFLITEEGAWRLSTVDSPVSPKPGQTLIALVLPAAVAKEEPDMRVHKSDRREEQRSYG